MRFSGQQKGWKEGTEALTTVNGMNLGLEVRSHQVGILSEVSPLADCTHSSPCA